MVPETPEHEDTRTMNAERSSFRNDFTWGAAAAAYQIEGAWDTDGKGPSIWDVFSHTPGKVFRNQTGDIACDHYHRYRDDVRLMSELGLQAYRMSISWPRIVPEGTGKINATGLDFYDKLVDELLAAGVDPWVTLYHWDLPYALYLRGGWLNREIADWFAEYATVIVDRLSDRVTHWMTINEIQNFCTLGHLHGTHAPGLKLPMSEILIAAHNVLLAHGKSIGILRARSKKPVTIGWAPAGFASVPVSDTAADIEAARESMLGNHKNAWGNAWFIDPAVLGTYPEATIPDGARMPPIKSGDMETICQPLDFFGVNVYFGTYWKAGANGPEEVANYDGFPMTRYNWTVLPEAMYWGSKFYYDRYELPLVITENGVSLTDWVSVDGKVHDPQRIDYLTRYLRELKKAAADGVDVRGYFHWSFMDNFEWSEGYKERFGLVYIDFPTQQRIPKDSAAWYKGVIETNGSNL